MLAPDTDSAVTGWIRRHLLVVMFSTLIVLQAATVILGLLIYNSMHNQSVRINNTRDIAEAIAYELEQKTLKVTVGR